MLYMFHDAGRAYLPRSVFGLRIQYNTLLGVLAMLLIAPCDDPCLLRSLAGPVAEVRV